MLARSASSLVTATVANGCLATSATAPSFRKRCKSRIAAALADSSPSVVGSRRVAKTSAIMNSPSMAASTASARPDTAPHTALLAALLAALLDALLPALLAASGATFASAFEGVSAMNVRCPADLPASFPSSLARVGLPATRNSSAAPSGTTSSRWSLRSNRSSFDVPCASTTPAPSTTSTVTANRCCVAPSRTHTRTIFDPAGTGGALLAYRSVTSTARAVGRAGSNIIGNTTPDSRQVTA